MIYIVTWIISNIISDKCPAGFVADEYGRRFPLEHRFQIQCWEPNATKMKRQFNEMDSALAFYNKALDRVDSVRIDSLPVTALNKK